MASPDPDPPTVAVIGAGLTGLLAAQGLKKNGFKVVVFEQEASIDARPQEWTMLIHWAMPLFEKLVPAHILKDLNGALCNPHLEFTDEIESLPCYNGVTGELLFSSPTPGSRRVSRRRLRKLLTQDIDIRWNQSLTGFQKSSKGITLEFSNGESFDAHHLLGADGTWSKVRHLLLGPEQAQPLTSGFLFATGITEFNDAEKTNAIIQAHPVAALMMGTNAVGAVGVMAAGDPSDKSTWTTFWVKIWQGNAVDLKDGEALEYIKGNTPPLRDIFQSAIDWTPEGSYVRISEMKYWIPTQWDNHGGRVTLAGDAAHPMLIYRGQGFQHSITDVASYVDALTQLHSTEESPEQIIGAYESEMIERGAKAVQQSLSEAEKSLDIEKIGQMLMAKQGHGKST